MKKDCGSGDIFSPLPLLCVFICNMYFLHIFIQFVNPKIHAYCMAKTEMGLLTCLSK